MLIETARHRVRHSGKDRRAAGRTNAVVRIPDERGLSCVHAAAPGACRELNARRGRAITRCREVGRERAGASAVRAQAPQRRPLTAKTGVRVPEGAPIISMIYHRFSAQVSNECPINGRAREWAGAHESGHSWTSVSPVPIANDAVSTKFVSTVDRRHDVITSTRGWLRRTTANVSGYARAAPGLRSSLTA